MSPRRDRPTHAFAEALLPRPCLGCGERLRDGPAPIGLCRRCHGRLAPLDLRRRCAGCLRPLPAATAGRSRCLGCAALPTAIDEIVAAWSYREPLRSVLHAVKFRRLDFLAEGLAREAMARGTLAAVAGLDAVVPVPLSLWRRLGRGFNQAERIARPIARHLRLPLVEALRRESFASRRQSRLGRLARHRNPAAGLRPRSAAAELLAGRSVLLVDDIVTTGATLAAAARLLRAAGAVGVVAFALAATPRAAFGEPAELA